MSRCERHNFEGVQCEFLRGHRCPCRYSPLKLDKAAADRKRLELYPRLVDSLHELRNLVDYYGGKVPINVNGKSNAKASAILLEAAQIETEESN